MKQPCASRRRWFQFLNWVHVKWCCAWLLDQEICDATGPHYKKHVRAVCCRKPNHRGVHIACDGRRVIARWK